uniref:Uncharacterized protein n=1 Tax=Anopheles farauti TaxID=69004 RepID=A0A182QJP5_9DIPT
MAKGRKGERLGMVQQRVRAGHGGMMQTGRKVGHGVTVGRTVHEWSGQVRMARVATVRLQVLQLWLPWATLVLDRSWPGGPLHLSGSAESFGVVLNNTHPLSVVATVIIRKAHPGRS